MVNAQGKIQKGKCWKIARKFGGVKDNDTPIHKYGPNMMRLCATFLMDKDATKTTFMTALQQKLATSITVSSEDATIDQTNAQVSFLEALLSEGDEPLLSDLMHVTCSI